MVHGSREIAQESASVVRVYLRLPSRVLRSLVKRCGGFYSDAVAFAARNVLNHRQSVRHVPPSRARVSPVLVDLPAGLVRRIDAARLTHEISTGRALSRTGWICRACILSAE